MKKKGVLLEMEIDVTGVAGAERAERTRLEVRGTSWATETTGPVC